MDSINDSRAPSRQPETAKRTVVVFATPGALEVHSPIRPVSSGLEFIRSSAICVAAAWSSPA